MLNIRINDEPKKLTPRITVVGVGGAGGNAVNNMIRSNMEGCDFLVCNTDAQALQQSLADRHLQIGTNVTRGLGAGARPDVGRAAAEESIDEILSYLDGSNMVFIACGMGGGTGTGAAPVIARAARDAGILTVGVTTKPFHFEGTHRMRLAEEGIKEMQEYVDTLIIIPNQNLFRIANEKTTFAEAFKMADDVLMSGVRGVTDLMVMPGLVNLDFSDIRSVMAEMGKAMMGTGEATGERRAQEAAEAAISNPLLDDVSMKGAKGVLINITGGMDMTLYEVDEAANRIREEVDPDANIIFGSTFNESMDGTMRVSVVATGIDAVNAQRQDTTRSSGSSAVKPKTDLGAPRDGGMTLGKAIQSSSPVSAPVEKVAAVQEVVEPVVRTGTDGGSSFPTSAAQAMGGIVTPQGHHIPPAGLPFRENTETAGLKPYQSGSNFPAAPQLTRGHAATVPTAERVGGVFIPPQPATADQFAATKETVVAPPVMQTPEVKTEKATEEGFNPFRGNETPAASVQASVTADDEPKRSPSLFERITGTFSRENDTPVERKVEPSLGGTTPAKTGDGDDEFDIPAFLRRQAN